VTARLLALAFCLLVLPAPIIQRGTAGGGAPPTLASGPTQCGTAGLNDKSCAFTATAGSDRILLVIATAEIAVAGFFCDAAQFQNITYGTCTLTTNEAFHARTDGGDFENCTRAVYCPEASIPAGSNTLTVDILNGSSIYMSVYYAVLTGVNQADIIDISAVDQGDLDGEDPFEWSTGTLAANTFQWITATFDDAPDYSASTIASPFTEQLDLDLGTCCTHDRYDASGTATGAQTISIDQTTAYTGRIAGGMVSFNGQ